ncbi:calcium/sodium antiporter [Alishewanella tabrizica]|uniref:calcium/sodium antiporter n=1 Tax=Alishewanella tabrizica TaxID=671278 RepID=UPI001E3D9AB6|nr:calcium/sodium antiporter [Alishewanella tabrizica]
MLLAIIFVIVGLVLLIWSADRFVFGASSVARNSGISPMIIGLTIVAMGSSAPEMLVSATAAAQGRLDTSVGNAIGSNITNILLVIGLVALLKPISVTSVTLKREFPMLIGFTLLGFYLLSDHSLTRAEGVVLLLAFIGFIALLVFFGKRATADDPLIADIAAEMPEPTSNFKAAFWIISGLILLLASSQLLVHGAVTIARYAGMSDLVIGLTIIAIGTSLPELAASVIGILKGEDDLALGNIIGSNIFNILAVLGLGAVIGPSSLDINAGTRDSYVMIAATVLMLLMSIRIGQQQRINRVEGAVLLTGFIGYQYLLFSQLA